MRNEMNLINRLNAIADSPTPGSNWNNESEKNRIKKIKTILSSKKEYQMFEVLKAPENGQVVLKTNDSINVSERGIFLLDLEIFLKEKMDEGITVWLEPVRDKSKLRNLRGIKLKSI